MTSKRVYRAYGMYLTKDNGVWSIATKRFVPVASARTLEAARQTAFNYILGCVKFRG